MLDAMCPGSFPCTTPKRNSMYISGSVNSRTGGGSSGSLHLTGAWCSCSTAAPLQPPSDMDLAYDGKGKTFRIDGIGGNGGRHSSNSLHNDCYFLRNVKSVLHKYMNSLLSNSHLGPASVLAPNPTLLCMAPVENPDLVPLSNKDNLTESYPLTNIGPLRSIGKPVGSLKPDICVPST